ncbi:hypothetical protein AHAT_11890 [Agarivorans sp. Toyoura001]|uniref:hypothetical protein n=1 Tax=Agarivorans sp. Toyoura001 TaxID=2283141 RepID=UPI0010F05D73|nr:hypothetical protein [Agarivorans sp. Toyoura001]GDY25299.1 hypothetical protein AHAT_11890 [Agarivorans sp. Toyoura001]
MNLQLNIDALLLGKHHQLDDILGLSEQVLEPQLRVSDEHCLRHFSFSKDVVKRIENLDFSADAVFLLLPEAPLEEAKGEAYQALLALAPALEQATKVYLFPYGRSAMQLALRQALKLFEQQTISTIQLVAYHQDERLQANAAESESPSVASQCFIAASLQPAKKGFTIPWASYEVQTPDKSVEATVSALIQRYRQQCGESLTQCYLPSALNTELMDAWLNAYQQFQDCVGSRSQVIFADARVGDLGVCSGLYNLCHLFMHYQRKKHAGVSFQLDISDKTYRSAMMLAWVA